MFPTIIPFVHDTSSLSRQLCKFLTNLYNKCVMYACTKNIIMNTPTKLDGTQRVDW